MKKQFRTLILLLVSASLLLSSFSSASVFASGFETYTMYGFDRVNVRDEYNNDEQYANFRAVNIGGLGHNVLLRGSSPVDPSLNRSTYVDRLMEAYHVNYVINLSDTDEWLDSYRESKYYHSYYYDSLRAAGKVLVAQMPANGYDTDWFCKEITNRLSTMAVNEGPYFIHCKEGKDRSGFGCMLLECLMGASFRDISDDYIQTFVDYTRSDHEFPDSQRRLIEETNVRAFLGVITALPNETDFDKVNLIKAAEAYLIKGGMSSDSVKALRDNLSKSYADPASVYEGNYYGPVFDADYYMSHYPEAANYAKGNASLALKYFVLYGISRRHSGNAAFSPLEYMKQYTDVVSMYGSDMKMYYFHYIRHGQYGEGAVFDDPELYVTMMYNSFLYRNPDAGGLSNWSELLKTHGCTGAKAVYGFVYSPEYQSRNFNNKTYISQLYEIIFRRSPDAGGLKAWQEVLDNGASRKKVLEGFVNSVEMSNLCKLMGVEPGKYSSDEYIDSNYGAASFVATLYRIGLNRSFKQSELESWTRVLVEKERSPLYTALAFLDGGEYRNLNRSNDEFVSSLYKTLLGREGSRQEIAGYVELLKKGISRSEIIVQICTSEEFMIVCNKKHI